MELRNSTDAFFGNSMPSFTLFTFQVLLHWHIKMEERGERTGMGGRGRWGRKEGGADAVLRYAL